MYFFAIFFVVFLFFWDLCGVALKNANIFEDDLLSIWAFGLRMLNWKNEDDHSSIDALGKAIEICTKRNNIPSIYKKICKMGKAEISVRADPNRYIIPKRWCDTAEVEAKTEETHNFIEKYLQMDELEYHDRKNFFR